MKKTISITLGGRIFSIEEDGYAVLEAYLNGLKRHFIGDDSAEELMADIEASIGEKFSEKMNANKQAITNDDVNEVIGVMGKVEEIVEEDENPQPAQKKTDTEKEGESRKRLYRDRDNKVIGGVCAGLAAYFGISVIAVRIGFIILGLLHGVGIIIYLILWAAMPSAETNTQKLEMRGKPMNVDELTQLVKEKTKKVGADGKEAFEQLKRKDDSILNKILNIPVIIIGAIFRAIRTVLKALGPIISTIIGIFILLGATMGLAAATVAGSFMLFPTNSGRFFSDLPINELLSQPLYYVGVVSGYFLAVVPLVFLFILATTLIRRKNSFRILPVAVLVGIWIIAASAGAVSAREIFPWAYNRVQEIQRASTVTKAFTNTNFNAIVASGDVNVKVTKGENYAVNVTGLKNDMDRLLLSQKDATLTVSDNGGSRGPCLFCMSRRLAIEVVLPELTSFTGSSASDASIEGFSKDLLVSANDYSQISLALNGQSVTSTIQDGSSLSISGGAKQLVMSIKNRGRLYGRDLIVDTVHLTQSDVTDATLQGTANTLSADLRGYSHLDADDFTVLHAMITTQNMSQANVSPQKSLEATSEGDSYIKFNTINVSTTLQELGNSQINGPDAD